MAEEKDKADAEADKGDAEDDKDKGDAEDKDKADARRTRIRATPRPTKAKPNGTRTNPLCVTNVLSGRVSRACGQRPKRSSLDGRVRACAKGRR